MEYKSILLKACRFYCSQGEDGLDGQLEHQALKCGIDRRTLRLAIRIQQIVDIAADMRDDERDVLCQRIKSI